ncbi:MAG TPA: BON domain-containing protein [Pirellulales bacterium]|nr:BON domain-containing protein [Pirellulales bacterium]
MITGANVYQPASLAPEFTAGSGGIVEQARHRLQASPYPSHRQLRCSFRDGVLTVDGHVSSYYLRQMAWALLADLEAVEEFVDHIEVADQD